MIPDALAGLQKRLRKEGFTSYGEIIDWIKVESD
jgi:hypothetical protein